MKKRILGAFLILIIAVPLLIIGKMPFKIFIMVLSVLGMYEFIKLKDKEKHIPLVMKLFAYVFVLISIIFNDNYYTFKSIINYKIVVCSFLIFLLPIVLINDQDKYNISDALYLLGGVLFLSVGFNVFIIIRNISLVNIIYVILIAVVTDMFAYFGGRLIGKHKLCEKISPNKTIEGSVVGSFVGTLVPTLFYVGIIDQNVNLLLLVFVTFLLSAIGQMGDLFFSSIKRTYKIKDFSNLIPGHGGVLDRFDSLLFIAITYMLFMNVL